MKFDINHFLSHCDRVLQYSVDYKFTRPEREIVLEIIESAHIGDGYFSKDRVYDELTELLGVNERSRNLFNDLMC